MRSVAPSAKALLRAAAAVLLLGSTGCTRPRWELVDVVNTSEGAVLVWSHSHYRKRVRIGMDHGPSQVKTRATFQGFRVTEAAGGLAGAPARVGYQYRPGLGLLDRPDFFMSGDSLAPEPCLGYLAGALGGCPVGVPLGVFQIGGRGEALSIEGRTLAMGPGCAVSVPEGIGGPVEAGAGRDRSLRAAYHPERRVLYLVEQDSLATRVYLSAGCGALHRVLEVPPGARVPGAIFAEVMDVVPSGDPERPVLLMGYSERAGGIYRQRQAILRTSDGTVHPLPADYRFAMGFWRASPDEVLVGYQERGFDGVTADLTVYDARTRRARTLTHLRR